TFGVGEPGPAGPIFSGPQQQPFLCETEESGLGPPLVDNLAGIGMPVFDSEGNLLGYSQYCSAPMQIRYYYRSTDSSFKPLDDRAVRPPDLAQTTTSDGLTVDYIVRVELGTINRFIYGIAMLAPYDGTPHNPNLPRPWTASCFTTSAAAWASATARAASTWTTFSCMKPSLRAGRWPTRPAT